MVKSSDRINAVIFQKAKNILKTKLCYWLSNEIYELRRNRKKFTKKKIREPHEYVETLDFFTQNKY
jgi:hypothetical protein